MAEAYTDVIIAGGGAAGIFAAVNLAVMNPALAITVLEKSPKLLSKVKISGGGRCNVTHACFDNKELVKFYPRGEKQLRGAFSRFTTTDTVEWFESRGVKLKAEADGRMFPTTDDSQTIIDCLLQEASRLGINIVTGRGVTAVKKTAKGFEVTVNDSVVTNCRYFVAACGGHHKDGAYEWLHGLGHTIVPPVPSLFTFNLPKHRITQLMGVAVPQAQVKISGTKLVQQGPLLITHWGLSGPAVLKLSAWGARLLNGMEYRYEVVVNWIPPAHEEAVRQQLDKQRREHASSMVHSKQPYQLPRRLWEFLCSECGIKETTRWADLPAKQANQLAVQLTAHRFQAHGKTTFKEEFVTAGGVNLSEVDFRTMESRVCPGVYFAGEVVDIDGVTGGFNFQAAWTTAYIVAEAIAGKG